MTATYGTLTAEQRSFYELTMLPRAVPPFSHLYFGQRGVHPPTTLPENKGDTINWRLLAAFSVVSTPLTEGITPDAHDISISAITGTVAEYGAFVKYTRKLAAMGIDKVAAEASDALGEQAGDSLDQLVRDVVVAGTTVQYASTATARNELTVAMKLTAAEALEAVATLKTNKARTIENGLFAALIHPHAEYDAYTDTTWQNLMHYSKDRGEKNPWTTGYVGDALGCRWFCTPNAKVWEDGGASSVSAYAAMIIGKAAFGIGGLAAYMPGAVKNQQQSADNNNTMQKVRPLRLINKDFGSAGTADPLDQRATIAWYTTFVTKRLTEAFMVRLEHGATLGA
jgi:N4-gp56 family major capsid protein